MRLYRKLSIAIRPNNFTFSFSSNLQDHSPFLLYNGHSGLKGISLPDCIRRKAYTFQSGITYIRLISLVIISYLFLLALSLFHYTLGHLYDPAHHLSRETLQSWLARHPRLFSSVFNDAVLYPLFSAMTTSSLEQVQQIPTSEVLLYIATTFMRSHYTVTKGVRQIQHRLIEKIPAENLHLSISVLMVRFGDYQQGEEIDHVPRTPLEKNKIRLITCHSHTQEQHVFSDFDHVIFATPASRSALILNDTIDDLDQIQDDAFNKSRIQSLQDVKRELERIRYENSTVINHTDESLMPPSRRDWRDLNLITSTFQLYNIEGKNKKKSDHTMATHACHQLKDGRYAFQTTNTLITPDPASILSMSTFPRALTTPKQKIEGLFCWRRSSPSKHIFQHFVWPQWQLELGELQKHSNTNLFFCGSYSQGIPLLEGCVNSSALVVSEILEQDNPL